MRDGNVIRVDFKNKKRFGGLKVVSSDDPEVISDEPKQEVVESIMVDQTDSQNVPDAKTPVVVVDQRLFEELVGTLMFYAHSTVGQPGWDGGARAKAALANMFKD